MKKVFIIIGSLFAAFVLSIPIGLWVELHQMNELREKYPEPKKIMGNYYVSSGCAPFVYDDNDSLYYYDFCDGIYFRHEDITSDDGTAIITGQRDTIIQSNSYSNFCFSSDKKENIAFFFCHEDKFEDAETTIWFKSVGCINNADCIKIKKTYLAWAVYNVKSHQLSKFQSFQALKDFCSQNHIQLGEWYQLCEYSCPPIDMDSYVDYCSGHWWNTKWKRTE
ncbi:MAG: hypothetical protein IKE65_07740 [Clostridia bacterium]|nr:hypothetical protein [Clostridia bacterium]